MIAPTESAMRPTEHDRRHLIDASVSANTRRYVASTTPGTPPLLDTLRGF